LIVAANLRFAVKIQDTGKPEARRHEIRSKAAVAESALTHVRTHGINQDTVAALDAEWSKSEVTPGGRDVAARLRTAARTEGAQAKPGEKLVASMEVLESVFGKLKRLEGSYAGDGFTGLSWAVGA
jgi:hypothetical protein